MPLSTRPRLALNTPSLLHVMAAHSPLSAKLVEEAGFDGVWASGFELSALYGLPDVSLVSMTQHLDMVRAMAIWPAIARTMSRCWVMLTSETSGRP